MNQNFTIMYRLRGTDRIIHVFTSTPARAVTLVCQAYPQATRVHVV